jgi:hypothetical protein
LQPCCLHAIQQTVVHTTMQALPEKQMHALLFVLLLLIAAPWCRRCLRASWKLTRRAAPATASAAPLPHWPWWWAGSCLWRTLETLLPSWIPGRRSLR